MKIKKLEVENFMGLVGNYEVKLPQIGCLIGPNGIGKTSLITAIRYGLTGEKPEGDIINKSCSEASVSITLEDEMEGTEYEFTRIENREKATKFLIDGKMSTKKAMNSFISNCIGIPMDKVKVLSSAEVVSNMKPQEFGNFIMDYVAKKIAKPEILDIIPDMSEGMKKIIGMHLSEEVDISEIDNLLQISMEERKVLKRNIKGTEEKLSTMITSRPKGDFAEIEKELNDIRDIENLRKMYRVKMDAYNAQETSKRGLKDKVEKLKEEIESMKEIGKPNILMKEKLQEKKKSLQDSKENLKSVLFGLTKSTSELEKTLSALESSVCPISPLITCHEDKSVAKEDIKESINVNKESIEASKKEIQKTEEQLKQVDENLERFQECVSAYTKKCLLLKELKETEATIDEMDRLTKPEKPKLPEEEVIEKRLYQLEQMKKRLMEWTEKEKTERNLLVLKEKYKDYDRICSAFSAKGEVRNHVLNSYTGILEDTCNQIVEMIRPELHFTVRVQDGIEILMDAGNGIDLPYASLSGGEKAYFLFVVMDMLNKLAGTNLLFLDELSVIDDECFNTLLEIIQENVSEYDHIILAAVDHRDTVESVDRHSIPQISLEKLVRKAS